MTINIKHEQDLTQLAQLLVESQLTHNEEKLLYEIFSSEMITREENKLLQMGYNTSKIPANQNEIIKNYIQEKLNK